MAIVLDHTIMPAHDKEASAKFFARIFGLAYEGPAGHFAPVRVNDTLTLDFDNSDQFQSHHYAFHVSDDEFDAVFGRIKGRESPTGAGPLSWRICRSTPAGVARASTSGTPTAMFSSC